MKPGITDDTSHDHGSCRAVAEILARIGDKWTVYIVKMLAKGPMRFNEIRKAIPAISQRMLSLTLRGLERDGLVTRTVTPSIPPRVDYELTSLGLTLIGPLQAVSLWAISNRGVVENSRSKFDTQNAGTKTADALSRRRKAATRPLPTSRNAPPPAGSAV